MEGWRVVWDCLRVFAGVPAVPVVGYRIAAEGARDAEGDILADQDGDHGVAVVPKVGRDLVREDAKVEDADADLRPANGERVEDLLDPEPLERESESCLLQVWEQDVPSARS